MKRLFTFGCSFTSYRWPTWADFIGTQFEVFENWGRAGAGNYFILSKLYECDAVHHLTADDTVLVMLTSVPRFDMYTDTWNLNGNVYTQRKNFGNEFFDRYWSETYAYQQSWLALRAIKTLLQLRGCNHRIMCAFSLDPNRGEYGQRYTVPEQLTSTLEREHINPSEDMYQWTKDNFVGEEFYWFDKCDSKKPGFDHHPTVHMHAEWIRVFMPDFWHSEFGPLANEWHRMIDTTSSKNNENVFGQIMGRGKSTGELLR